KFAVTALLHHEIISTLRARLGKRRIRFLDVAGAADLARGLAFGISGAGQKLSPTPALENHTATALFAGLVRIRAVALAVRIGDAVGGDVARRFALFIGAGEELTEATEFEHHRASAFLADLFG